MQMEFERVELGAGARLHGLETDKFKTICLHAVFQLPLDPRAPQISLIPMILRRGTRSWPDMVALGRRGEELFGAAVSADALRRGERMLMAFDVDVIDPVHLPGRPLLLAPALEILGEWMLAPARGPEGFRQDYFEQERQNQIHQIRTLMHDPGRYAAERLRQIMCAAEPYGIPPQGTEEEVERLRNEPTFELSREILRHAPLDVFFVGPRPVARIAEDLRPIISALGRSEIDTLGPPAPHPPVAGLRRIEEQRPVGQGKLAIGMRIPQDPPPEEQIAMSLMTAVYGGGTFSKLFREVRERLSLAYYASAGIERSKGLLFVQAGVEAENGARVIDLCLELLEEMRRGVFDEEALEYARRSILNRLNGVADSAHELIGFELEEVLSGRGWNVATYEEAVRRASAEQVVRAAQAVVPDVAFFLEPTAGAEGAEEGLR